MSAAGKGALIAVAAVAFLGWVIANKAGRSGSSSARPSTKLADPAEIHVEGIYTHAPSGLSFGAAYHGWQRSDVQRYDEEGNDIGVGYDRIVEGLPVSLTIYVFPPPRDRLGTPMDFATHMQAEKDNLEHTLGISKPLRLVHDARRRTVGLEYETPHGLFGPVPTRSLLVLHAHGDWRLKYRITVPARARDAVVRALRPLLQDLGLPPSGLTIE